MNITKQKLYLLVKMIRELARYRKEKQRHNLNQKAAILDQLFSLGMDNTIKYYKNRLEVMKDGNNKRGTEQDDE